MPKKIKKNQPEQTIVLNFTDMGETPDYLSMIESLCYEVEACGLMFEIIPDQESLISLSEFLSISLDQAAVFSVLAELSLREDVTIETLSEFFKCKVVRVLSIFDHIEALEKSLLVKRIVNTEKRRESFKNISFTVPKNVIEALYRADQDLLRTRKVNSFPDLLDNIKSLVEDREDVAISQVQLMREVEELIAQNPDIPFVQFINGRLQKTSSKLVALCLAMSHFNHQQETAPEYFAGIIFSNFRDQIEFNRNIYRGSHELVSKKVAWLEKNSEHKDRSLALSDDARKLFPADFPEQIMAEPAPEGVISHLKIKEKTLCFDPDMVSRVGDLEKMLGFAEFQRFTEEALKNKMSPGITAIFFGHPGTGKTELALQLAKKNRRDLFMVDLSQTRSMWFGESEKIVKQIFDNYRDLLKTRKPEPILFINEADGLLSHRLSMGRNPGPVSQTQNTIQNILLQELEQFKGILIATTNLTTNLDKAFERRFLIKIEFPRPGETVRQQIWLDKLPELTPEMAATLAHRFDFTGGQIDNQVKQLLIKRVLQPEADLMQTLIENSEKELGFSSRRPIGFN